jgi:hypothetical protein
MEVGLQAMLGRHRINQLPIGMRQLRGAFDALLTQQAQQQAAQVAGPHERVRFSLAGR